MREVVACFTTLQQPQIEAVFGRPQSDVIAAARWAVEYGLAKGERALANI